MKCSILSAACCALVGRCHCAACCGGLSVTRFHFSIPSCGQFRYDLWSFTTDGFYRNNWGFRYVCWVETKVGASCVWPARSEHFKKNWWVLTLSAGKNFSHLRNHFRVQDPSKKTQYKQFTPPRIHTARHQHKFTPPRIHTARHQHKFTPPQVHTTRHQFANLI